MKNATMQSSYVNYENSSSPDAIIIIAEITTALMYCIIKIKETLSLSDLSLRSTSWR